ncbi:MarR family winged helix-turn-helix transcriptional regulator [Sphaerisporangium sp. NPDC005289]|uniref:MarR family winged helix-turn-helix transcriptional regulator n=1 Tax=Sphaerisporangium sp. NPDC005289 TaxID=3155247 RepID=UPI00339FFF77
MNSTANPTPARLRTLPSWVINQTAIAANRLTDRALAGTGSRRHHFAMLAALDELGPSSQAELGRCTGIDRSDVVAVVTAMAERGFLEQRPDPAHGRRNIVTLTPAGKDHLEMLSALLADAQNELLHALSPAESRTIVELLTRVLDSR